MKIRTGTWRQRRVWELDNEALSLTVMEGGGHLARLALHDGPDMNPYWAPVWKSVEPWDYRRPKGADAEAPLLASISGHNVCFSFFGGASPAEQAAGLTSHGEAPLRRWKVTRRTVSAARLTFTCGCELPAAQMRLARTFSIRRGSSVIRVREDVTNLSRRDLPYTFCEHVTFGPPFLQKGVTVFDMSATKGHTYPTAFGPQQRLKTDTAFTWPMGPGVKGPVDLRTIGVEARRSGDFSAQLMDPRLDHAWFSALNPKAGLMVAYVWRRADFPWLGNWEENYSRRQAPWGGRTLTRGMEFSNTPFPMGLQQAVERGAFHGVQPCQWLPARGTRRYDYSIIARSVPLGSKGVADIRPRGEGFDIDLPA